MNMKWLAIVTAVLLLLGIPSGWWPYEYYVFLRWVVSVSSVVVSYGFYKSKLLGWALVFGVLAFLFNPISPIYLSKSSWVWVDLISAVLFFLVGYSFKKKKL